MSGKRYTEEFKIAAVKQVAERGHPAIKAEAKSIGESALLSRAKVSVRPSVNGLAPPRTG